MILRIISWAMYDLANQFFGLNIIALYFVRWVTVEKNLPELAYAGVYAVSTLAVAVLMPWLGAIADERRSYRLFLTIFTLVSVGATLLIAYVRAPLWALTWFAVANIGCQGGAIFYNALLPGITPPGKIGLLSGLGKVAGYVGAVICLLLSRRVFAQHGYAAVFAMTGWLFLAFSLPCLLFVPDPPRPHPLPAWRELLTRYSWQSQMRAMLRQVLNVAEMKGMRVFFKAVFLGLSAVQVIVLFMTVYVGQVFGMSAGELTTRLIVGTMFAILGSFAAGVIGDRVGHKQMLRAVFGSWTICLLLASVSGADGIWLIAAWGGLNLGATWVSARAFGLTLMPPERVGEMFGILNLVAFAAGIAGPLYWGVWRFFLSPFDPAGYRISLGALMPLAAGCWFLLRRAPESSG